MAETAEVPFAIRLIARKNRHRLRLFTPKPSSSERPQRSVPLKSASAVPWLGEVSCCAPVSLALFARISAGPYMASGSRRAHN